MPGVVDPASFPGADQGAQISAAIAALPPRGGVVDARNFVGQCSIGTTITIDRPVQLLLGAATYVITAVNGFEINACNFSVLGLARGTTALQMGATATPATSRAMFAPSGVWSDAAGDPSGDSVASPSFILEKLTLDGNSFPEGRPDASALVWPDVGSSNSFQDGLLRIEDCLIENFGSPDGPASALQIGRSVYLCLLRNNVFSNNYRAVTLASESDARIENNLFFQGPGGGPSLTLGGPDVTVNGNFFTRHLIEDPSADPDILLQPTGGAVDGGYVWIENNKFGPERENLNANRTRILAHAPEEALVCAPAVIRGNLFGAAAFDITGVSRVAGIATVTTAQVGNQAIAGSYIRLFAVSDAPSFNGTYRVIASDNHTFSLAQPGLPDEGASGSPAHPIGFAALAGDYVEGPSGPAVRGAAIRLQNPIHRWDISQNFFYNYGLLIDDVQPLPSAAPPLPNEGYGLSLCQDNRAVSFPGSGGVDVAAVVTFSHAGQQFGSVRPSLTVPEPAWGSEPVMTQAVELRNRLAASELLTTWTHSRGMPKPAPATDPFGTSRAVKVSRDGTTAGQSLSHVIDLSTLPAQGRLYLSFSARQGSVDTMTAGIYDTGQAPPGFLRPLATFTVSPVWKRYQLVVAAQFHASPSRYELRFYPAGPDQVAGDIYLFAPQVADYDCDYLPTGGHPAVDTTSGSRFELAPTLTSVKTSPHAADAHPGSVPSLVAGSTLGAGGTNRLADGSTDMAGGIELLAGTGSLPTSGSVEIRFAKAYPATPLVFLTASDATGMWSEASQVKVVSSSGSGFKMRWHGTLQNGLQYNINYLIVGLFA